MLQLPGRLGQGRARRFGVPQRAGKFRVAPQRQQRGAQLRLGLRDLARVPLVARARLDQPLLRDEPALEQPFLLLDLQAGKLPRRLGLRKLRADGVDLRRTPPDLQVGELGFCAFQALLLLEARGGLVRLLEDEHRLAFGDLGPAANVQLLQLACKWGGKVDELAFDVALVARRRRLVAGSQQRAACKRGQRDPPAFRRGNCRPRIAHTRHPR